MKEEELKFVPRTGSCFWGHNWSKWEQYEQSVVSPLFNKEYLVPAQKRICLNCGKQQKERITS